jgi:hypothetical protein
MAANDRPYSSTLQYQEPEDVVSKKDKRTRNIKHYRNLPRTLGPYATSRKVVGSIPNEVTGIFN